MLVPVFFMQPASAQAQTGSVDPELLAALLCAFGAEEDVIEQAVEGLGYQGFEGCNRANELIEISNIEADVEVQQTGDGPNAGEVGVYEIEFDVTALEEDVYIREYASQLSPLAAGITFDITGSTQFQGGVTTNIWSTADEDNGYLEIQEGDTETIRFTVVLDNENGVDGQYRVSIETLSVGTTPGSGRDIQTPELRTGIAYLRGGIGGGSSLIHPADVNRDSEIDINEATGYAAEFSDREYSHLVQIGREIWQRGERYTFDQDALRYRDARGEVISIIPKPVLSFTVSSENPVVGEKLTYKWHGVNAQACYTEKVAEKPYGKFTVIPQYPGERVWTITCTLGASEFGSVFMPEGPRDTKTIRVTVVENDDSSSLSNLSISAGSSVVQGANVGRITWDSENVDRVDVLVCYETGSRDRCFYAQRNIANEGSRPQVRVGTNVPVGSEAYIKVRKAGDNSVAVQSRTFDVVASDEGGQSTDPNIKLYGLTNNQW